MIFSVFGYAYKADNSVTLFFNVQDIPSQTAGIDILIPIEENSDEYAAFNSYNDLFGINDLIYITDESEIAYYNVNGYISYLCHLKNADIDCRQAENGQFVVNVNNLDYFIEQGSFAVAFIDNQGNILSTTDTISIKNCLFRQFESVSITDSKAKVNYYFNPYYILPFVSLIIAVIVLVLLKLKKLHKSRYKSGDGSV